MEKGFLLFGSYPQSIVTDKEIVAAIEKKINEGVIGQTGVKEHELSDDTKREMLPSRFRHLFHERKSSYFDIEYNNGKYRVLSIYEDAKKITTVVFKFEPIRWNIVNCEKGKVELTSELILDYRKYNDVTETKIIDGRKKITNYNKYSTSTLRKWLNEDFLLEAFNEKEREIILEKVNKNYQDDDTTDYAYLLSEDEIIKYYMFHRRTLSNYSQFKKETRIFDEIQEGDWWTRNQTIKSRWRDDYYELCDCLFDSGLCCPEWVIPSITIKLDEKLISQVKEILEYREKYPFIFSKIDDEYKLEQILGDPEVVKIPSEYNGKPVCYIYDYVFYTCEKLKELYIPKTIKVISSSYRFESQTISMFCKCHNLQKIYIDRDNEYYSSGENNDCIIDKENNYLIYGVGNTIIPTTVKGIEGFAFAGNSTIETIEIPESVEWISDEAFGWCNSLKKIILNTKDRDIAEEFANKFDLFDVYVPFVNIDEESNNLESEDLFVDGHPDAINDLDSLLLGKGEEDDELVEDKLDKIKIEKIVNSLNDKQFVSFTHLFYSEIADLIFFDNDDQHTFVSKYLYPCLDNFKNRVYSLRKIKNEVLNVLFNSELLDDAYKVIHKMAKYISENKTYKEIVELIEEEF